MQTFLCRGAWSAQALEAEQRSWERRSCGEGAKGQRFYDWACFTVRVKGEDPAAGFAHAFLVVQRARPASTHNQEPVTDQARETDTALGKDHPPMSTPRQSQRAVARPEHHRRRTQISSPARS
jgi:hypothetical protein